MVAEEVGSKLVRFMYFVGAGLFCTKGINLYRDYERNAAIKAAEAAIVSSTAAAAAASPHVPTEMANGAATTAAK